MLLALKAAIGMMVGLLIYSCEPKDDLSPQKLPEDINYQGSNEPMLVLGKQKENPYSVENMRRAYANLTSNGRVADFDIQTTDLYIRFAPADSLELEMLLADTSMILWDYPLDFEVEVIGHYYHDPNIPDSLPTYQYTVVKPDFEFPNIQHEVLAELFLPEEYENDDENSGGRISNDFLEELEYEALRITGNLDEDESSSNGRVAASKWTPSGRVTVREVIGTTATANLLPVVNVKVKVKGWFYLSDTYTDTQGNYRLKSTKRKVDYKIEFESDRVKITNWIGWSRNHNGPNNRTSGWSPSFDWDDASGVRWNESWVNATLLNAAYECRIQVNRKGMQTPFPVGFWAGSGRAVNKLNIRVKYGEGTGRMITKPWTINEIKIWSDHNNGFHKGTDFLYRVSFHEFGHSMHARLSGTMSGTAKIIKESWADFVEHYFIIEYYPNQSIVSGKQTEDRADWGEGYTPLFIDLMDDDNQLTRLGGDRPNDNVRGYRFTQLQESLEKNKTLREVRDHLRDNYTNSTRGNLNELFDFYFEFE